MTKQQAISKMLMDKMAQIASRDGISITDVKAVREAFEFVFGEGSYDNFAGDLYHSLRGE